MKSKKYKLVTFLPQFFGGREEIGKNFRFCFLKFGFCAWFYIVSETFLLYCRLRGGAFKFSWHTEVMLMCSM